VKENVKESETPIVLPILILAGLCLLFGVYNRLPLMYFIQPLFEGHAELSEHLDFTSHALDLFNPVAGISILCLVLALAIHFYGWKRAGEKAYLASEVIHGLPLLRTLYQWSEARFFDLYEQGVRLLRFLSKIVFVVIDRPIDFLYEQVVTWTGKRATSVLQKAHNGHYANYLAWCIGGLLILVWVFQFIR